MVLPPVMRNAKQQLKRLILPCASKDFVAFANRTPTKVIGGLRFNCRQVGRSLMPTGVTQPAIAVTKAPFPAEDTGSQLFECVER